MGIFKRNENKETGKLPMGRKSRKAFAVYVAAVLCMTCFTTTAFAASDPLTVVNNLSDFIFGLIRAIGMILLGFGIVQILSLIHIFRRTSSFICRLHFVGIYSEIIRGHSF